MKCNCSWYIQFKKINAIVVITKVSATHTNGCNPSPKEKLSVIQRSTQSKAIDPVVFSHLICLRRSMNQRLPTRPVRSIIKDAFPVSMHLSCNAVIFLRDKVERLCLDHSTLGESYVNVSQSIKPDQWMQGLNNCIDDRAHHQSINIWIPLWIS